MRITNESYMIGYEGESYSRKIEYVIDDYLKDCQIYIEFEKTNGDKFTTKQIEDIESGEYLIPYSLLDEVGNLSVQLVAIRPSSNFILKSMIKTFYISQSINASDEILANESDLLIIGDLYEKVYNRAVALELDSSSGIIKLIGRDKDNNNIILSSIDLPTEKIIKNVYYDNNTKELVFEFENANDVRVPIGDIFNLSNYYTIEEINNLLNNIVKSFNDLINDLSYDVYRKTEIDNMFHETQTQLDSVNDDISNINNNILKLNNDNETQQSEIYNLNIQGDNQQELIDNLEYENSRLTKQIKNLQASVEGSTFIYEEDSGVAYEKDVPSEASPYAIVNKVGGMSYVVNNEIRNSAVTNIVSQGQNLFNLANGTRNELGYNIRCYNGEIYFSGKSTINGNIHFDFEKPLPAGTYSLSLFNIYTAQYSGVELGFRTTSTTASYQFKNLSKENDTYTFTTTENVLGIFIGAPSGLDLTGLTLYPMVVNSSTPSTKFKNYWNTTKELPSELLSLTDYGLGINASYNNYIDLVNKKYIRKCVPFYLNGSSNETIVLATANDTTGFYRFNIKFVYDESLKSLSTIHYNLVQNSGFPNYTSWNDYSGSKYEQVAFQNYSLFVVISKDKASNVNEFRNWLTNNPISGVYALNIPIEEDISHLLKDVDEFIEVEELGSMRFENEYEQDVPSTITYQVKVV